MHVAPEFHPHSRSRKALDSPAAGTPIYDTHGSTTALAGQTMSYDVANRHVGTQVTATGLNIICTRAAAGRIGSVQPGFSLAEVAAASAHPSFVAGDAGRLRGCR